MNDASRIYYGAKQFFVSDASPYAPSKRGPRAMTQKSVPSQSARRNVSEPQDTFEGARATATLKHKTFEWVPVDIGVPELDDDGDDAFAAPPLDLDELAACAGQSRMFGPIVGRAIMLAGSYFAIVATFEALKALGKDKLTLSALRAKASDLKKHATTAAISALRHVVGREICERTEARRANWVLLPGALGMSVNLLGSAELLGAFFPALQPIAVFAMGPAAICMALYGGYIAFTSARACLRSATSATARSQAKLPSTMSQEIWDKALQHNLARESSKRRWDAALGISGALQAVGAVTQWLLGPIWLLVLLPGTVGLVAGKIMRVKRLGAATVSPSVQPGPYDLPPHEIAERALQAQLRKQRLQTLQKDLANKQGLRGHLVSALQTVSDGDHPQLAVLRSRLQSAPTGPRAEAEELVAAVAALGGFAYLALAVARDLKLPPTPGARVDKKSYTITGAEVVDLVAQAPSGQQQAVLEELRRVVGTVASGPCMAIAQQQEGLLAELLGHMMEHQADGTPRL